MATTREVQQLDAAIGIPRPRLDAGAKLTGNARYAGDMVVPGMLYGRLVLSPYAHARIRTVETEEALQLAGVVAVLTAKDLPLGGTGGSRSSEPLAIDEVVFAGQPVALVLAESDAAAEDGAEAVFVDYEPLEAVLDLERAFELDAPRVRVGAEAEADDADMAIHGATGGGSDEPADERLSPNVIGRYHYAEGDADAVFGECAAVAEGRFRTSWIHQAYMEPQAAVAWVDFDGSIVVHTSTQGVFFARQQISNLFGLQIDKVRVVGETLGGAFGGKIGLIEPLVVAATLATQRPVRVVFTRSEDFTAANPAPSCIVEVKAGARADGTLAALRARILMDGGAFSQWSAAALAAGRVGGPYTWGAWECTVYGLVTNRFGAGAYRAPAAPQTAFAVEQLLDEIAQKLGLDPIELRQRNAPAPGDKKIDGGLWVGIGLREVLDAVREHPLWLGRHELPEGEGVGLAAGLFPGGKNGAGAVCRLDADGGLTVVTGSVDMTGTDTTLAAIAAETFGIPFERVRVAAGDTASSPHAPVSGGSTITLSVGSAVRAAAADARKQVLDVVADELEIDASDLEIADLQVRPVGSPDRGIPLARIAARSTGFGGPHAPIEGHGTTLPAELAPSAAAHLAHVRVDPETGEVQVLQYVAAQDVGKAINPLLCRGQMWGGAAQGIGWALYEQLTHDDEGQLLNGSFMTYAMPRTENVPPIETIIVEVAAPHGPFGAKGIGESAVVPGAATIANAVAAATGRRLRELPMTPQRVWRALAGSNGAAPPA